MIVTIFAAVRWKRQWQEAFASRPRYSRSLQEEREYNATH